jgi:NAD-dependent deacetylase
MTEYSKETRKAIQKAAALIRSAQYAVALTGAGSSTPSGIPDFRSAGSGLWTRFLPMEIASLTAFRQQPELFFEWLRPLASHMIHASPNPAHLGFAQLEKRGYLKTIITQNIDSLHHYAGSRDVLQVHGTLRTLTCTGCYATFDANGFLDPYLENGEIPLCPDCGRILKPDVVLFEEQLPVKVWLQARKVCETCDLMIVAGTSLMVMPVADLPMRAYSHGAHLIIVNMSPTYIDDQADVVIQGDVAEFIPAIANEVLHG